MDNVVTPLSYYPGQGLLSAKQFSTTAIETSSAAFNGSEFAISDSANGKYLQLTIDNLYSGTTFSLQAEVGSIELYSGEGYPIKFSNFVGEYDYTFPTTNGTTGQVLTTNGATYATLSWATPSSGITTGVANTFTALQTFSAGISASGATFSGNISAPNIVDFKRGWFLA